MSFFNELKASLEEAVEIKSGVPVPGRVTRYAVADVKTIGALNSRPDIPSRKREKAPPIMPASVALRLKAVLARRLAQSADRADTTPSAALSS